jgi:hypothetical protein
VIDNPKDMDKLVDCSENRNRASKDQACRVYVTGGKCTKAEKFGYPTGDPCILLKLNKVNWHNQDNIKIKHV